MSRLRAAVVGATGFTGMELVRLIVQHPELELAFVSSESKAGQLFQEVAPAFRSLVDLTLQSSAELTEATADVAFLALPHRVSMDKIQAWRRWNTPLVDLSADYRLRDAATYEAWYETTHSDPAGLDAAVYGLPELNRDKIREARLVANPGCYPTASALAALPLLWHALIQDSASIIVDAKSGVSGAGIEPKPITHFANAHDNFVAYGVGVHRHTPEIEQTLAVASDRQQTVQFTPHLLPVDRGILASVYVPAKPGLTQTELDAAFRDSYQTEPFVRLVEAPPTLKQVRGTNYCDIFPTVDTRTGNVMVFAAIDNLVKGAAGQAIQNWNLMAGLDESTGLRQPGFLP